MDECGIFSRSFSKYGTVYMEHLHQLNPMLHAPARKEQAYGQAL